MKKLECGKDNTGCDGVVNKKRCGNEDIWACVDHTNAEGGKAHFHYCGDCSDNAFNDETLSVESQKKAGWNIND